MRGAWLQELAGCKAVAAVAAVAAAAAAGGEPDWDSREGGPGRGPGPRAAGPVERTAAPKKDELVSGRLGRRFSLQGKQTVGTKARAGVGKARTVQPTLGYSAPPHTYV